ncbi:unnamed protein product [Symbiodinium sp. CCMP2592]|nr:unnamed protein product [Symbiodinium sp. CCMP2592]
MGPFLSARPSHSVTAEHDYVNPWLASYLGQRAAFEVQMSFCGLATTLRLDPREPRRHLRVTWSQSGRRSSCCDPDFGAFLRAGNGASRSPTCRETHCHMDNGRPGTDIVGGDEVVGCLRFSSRVVRPASLSDTVQKTVGPSLYNTVSYAGKLRGDVITCKRVTFGDTECFEVPSSQSIGSALGPTKPEGISRRQASQTVLGQAHLPYPFDAFKVGSASSLAHSSSVPRRQPINLPGDCPPGLLGGFGPPRPSAIAHMRAQAIQLSPQELTVFPLSEVPIGQLKILATAANTGRGLRRYTCLERQFHVMTRRAADDWSLTDYFADAIGASPETVRSARLLDPSMPNLQEPQIVTTAMALPADQVIASVVQACGVPPDSVVRAAQLNALFLQDARGRVWNVMPAQVEEMQWLVLKVDLARHPYLTPQAAVGTTATTTAMRANHDGPTTVTFIMSGCGTTVRLQPQILAQTDVQASVMSLVQALAIQGRIPEGAQLQLTGAFPRSRTANEYIVSLICFPPDGDVHIAYDPSNGGSYFQAMTVNPGTMPEDMVMPAQRERGLSVLINGIPQAAQNRPLCNGDLVQLVRDPCSHSVVPITFLLRELNRLRFLSIPMRMPRLQRPSAHFSEWQAQAATGLQLFYEARFAERKATMGMPDAQHQPIYLLGPNHVPIFVQIPGMSCPSLRQAQNEVHDLGLFDDSTALADTFELLFTIPVFVTVPECVSYATLLTPAPGFPMDFLSFSVTRGRPASGLRLPVDSGFYLLMPETAIDGAIAERRRGNLDSLPPGAPRTVAYRGRSAPSSSEQAPQFADGTSLVQTNWPKVKRRQVIFDRAEHDKTHAETQPAAAQRASIPTPLGRRHILECSQAAIGAQHPACRPISLSSAIPEVQDSEPGLLLGINWEIFDSVFSPFCLDRAHQTWQDCPFVEDGARKFVQRLPTWRPGTPFQALHLFVDGSFFEANSADQEDKAGWSICAIVCVNEVWHWAGFFAASCCPQGDDASLGLPVSSAFQAELSATVFALAVCVANPVPSAIGFDCQSAGAVAALQASSKDNGALVQAAGDLQAILRLTGHSPALYHIRSHEGHPFNCLADGLAKWMAQQPNATAASIGSLAEASKEGVLSWLWALFAPRGSLPPIQHSGKICDHAPDRQTPSLTEALAPFKPSPRRSRELAFKAMTFNCLTAASTAQQESIDMQLARKGISVAMIQETRSNWAGRKQSANYHILSAPSSQGVGGCQIWFAKKQCIKGDQEALHGWDPLGFSIVHASESMLLGLASVGGHKFLFISAHAPVNKAPAAVKHKWWQSLSSALRRAPPNCTPVMGIDANAQLAHADPSDCQNNCHFFVDCLRAHGMSHTPFHDAKGRPLTTWTSPTGLRVCIDYICAPSPLGSSLLSARVWEDFVGQVDHDHKPVIVDVHVRCEAQDPNQVRRCDYDFLRSSEGRHTLQALYRSLPVVPWNVDVDTHLDTINTHLREGLRQLCPSRADKPRSRITSDVAWELIRHRRSLKRTLFQQRAQEASRLLGVFFEAWKGQEQARLHAKKLHDQHIAFVARQVQDLNKRIRQRAAFDSAAAAKTAFNEARHKGPEALASLMRQILKSGRRYKPPKLVPVLKDEFGVARPDPESDLAEHFAQAERATACDPSCVRLHPPATLQHSIEACRETSVSALTNSFSQLADHKAAGLCGLPSEVFRHDALGAGLAFGPLALKMCMRKQTPSLWRGGVMVSVPKPGKCPFSTSGWRAILLMESSAKGVHGALRSAVIGGYKRIREEAQGGSLPGQPLQVAMAVVRGYVRHLRSTSACGGVLFLDGASAFYSTLRESLFGTEHMHDEASIHELACQVFPDEDDRLEFVALLLAPGLFEATGIAEPARRILTSTLHRTFFVYGKDFNRVFQTRSGTVPGAPLADVCFQLAFSKVLAQVRQVLCEADLDVRLVSHVSRGPVVPATSWMDDLAIPVKATQPSLLVDAARQVLHTTDEAIARIGVSLNFGVGKTEFLPILCGPGSRQAREELLGRTGGAFQITLRGLPSSVTLPRSYIHLGSVIDATASDVPDIKRRAALARELAVSLRKLLHNPHLTLPEKSNLVASMPLARLRHGAGFWILDGDQSRSAFHSAYMCILRMTFRQITGVTSKGRTDHEVCWGLHLLHPEEARAVDVIRHAGWMIQAKLAAITALWLEPGAWKTECLKALAILSPVLPGTPTPTALWDLLFQQPQLAKRWAKRLTKVCRKRNAALGDELLPRWREQQEACRAGWIFCRLPDTSESLLGEHECRICHRAFRSLAVLASHASKVHDMTAESALATCGTRCEVCQKEFWSTRRLHQHMRQNPVCRQVTIHADLEPAALQGEPGGAWLPAMVVQGPQPFWATLRPSDSGPQQVVTQRSGWEHVLGLLHGKRSGEEAFLAESFVELATKFHLTAEDRPLATLGCPSSDLLYVVLVAVQLKRQGFSGSLRGKLWKGAVRGDRAVFCPLGAEPKYTVPADWQECLGMI